MFSFNKLFSCFTLLVTVCQATQGVESQEERDKLTSLAVCREYQRDNCVYSMPCVDSQSISCQRCLDHCRVLLAGFGVFAKEQVDETTLASPSYQCRINTCFSTSWCQRGDESLCSRCLVLCAEEDKTYVPPTTTTTHRTFTYFNRKDCEIKRCFQTDRCDDEDDDPQPCQRCLDECRELTGGGETTPDDVSTQPPDIPLAEVEEAMEEEEQSTVDPNPVTLGPADLFIPVAEAEELLDDAAGEEQSTVSPDALAALPDAAAPGSHGDETLPADDLEDVADNPVRTCLFWCRWRGCARKKTCESCFQECDLLPVEAATSSPEQDHPVRPLDRQDEDDVGSGSAGDIADLLPVWRPDPQVDTPEAELKIPDPDSQFQPPVVDVPSLPDVPGSGVEANSDVIVPDVLVFQSDSEHAAQEPCLRNILSCAVECLSVCLKGSTRECVTCGTSCFIDMSFYRAEDRSAIRPSTSDARNSKSLSSNNCAVNCLKPCHRPTSDLCVLCATNCIGLIAAANSPPDSPGGAGAESVGAERGDVVDSVQVQQSNNFCVSYCEEFKDSATQFQKCTTDCCYWHPPCAS